MKNKKQGHSHFLETKKAGRTVLRFVGQIDEDTEFSKIKAKGKGELIIDLEDLTVMNSCGTRNWVKWVHSLPNNVKVIFVNCSRTFIDQANMFEGFFPDKTIIKSFFIPYFCESCRNSTNVLLPVTKKLQVQDPKVSKTEKCRTCGKIAEIDVIEGNYFRFLERVGHGA